MLKKIGYTLLALLLIAIIGVLVLRYMPEENVGKKKIDFTLDATEVFEEYSANEKAGNVKYIDKVLQVSGKIEDLMKDEKGAQVVLIAGSDMENGVMCTLEESETAKLSNKKVGDPISIKGRCSGMLMDVVLNKCVIMK